jgi:diadenosine tetraphosphatase ApaH/serine/threonine PP2A family protein phosphatase
MRRCYTRHVLALVYDVHGNLGALEAVLADAHGQGVSAWLLGGDYALFGPEPEKTVERLHDLPAATWIRGNGERWTARPHEAPDDPVVRGAIGACAEALGQARVTALGELPESAVLDGTRFVHGSPVSDVRSFAPEPTDEDEELLGGIAERRLVFGHTHLPFRRRAVTGTIELINPGSVGLPFDGDPRAAYALLHPDGAVEHRRVPYDTAAGVVRLRARWPDAAWVETVARRLEQSHADV